MTKEMLLHAVAGVIPLHEVHDAILISGLGPCQWLIRVAFRGAVSSLTGDLLRKLQELRGLSLPR